MADISEDVKDKVIEKNRTNIQPMDRKRTENIPNENNDVVSNTLHPPNAVPGSQMMPPQVRKKTSSFQITSVTQSRLSHDGGEDSADDLDESHTEELSSELIDCSKTTDIDNDGASSEDFSASTGVNNVEEVHSDVMFGGISASQGNVTIGVPVPILINAALSIAATNVKSVNTVPVYATSPISPIVPVVTELVVQPSDQQQQWENRFKVVKIVNAEPFKRGRWIIVDFNDPPLPPSVPPPESKVEATTDGIGSGNSSAGSSVQYVSGENHPSEGTAGIHDSNQSNVTAATQQSAYSNQTQSSSNAPSQTEYSNTNVSQSTSNAQSAVAQVSTLPNTTSQVNSVQSSSNPTNTQLPANASQNDPPTVIVQESNIVPTDQSNVPQVDNQENILQSAKQVSNIGPINQDLPVLKPLLDSLPPLGVASKLDDVNNGDEAESASGSNTVAIDNKIEQAMDLVKSHLMFAVREEVDVLREKISDLLDKVAQLELENGILKASASQETLNKIAQQIQQQQQQTANSTQTPSSQNQPNQPPTNNVHS